jgi:hypothetical protein
MRATVLLSLPQYLWVGMAAALLLFPFSAAFAQPVDCTQATIVLPASATAHEAEAVRMFVEEAARRTSVHWVRAEQIPSQGAGCVVVTGTWEELARTLPAALKRALAPAQQNPEAFSVQATNLGKQPVILVAGSGERGVLFGLGALLRKFSFYPAQATLDTPLHLTESPEKPLRSHQLGYRFKNNTYDAWNLAQFEQQIRDLAIFGANTIQMIAPHSDDTESSPLFPARALDTLLGVSRILDHYGLNCDIYYPEMEADYSRAADVDRELARFDELFRQIPRVDALWIPGGDPGHTPPRLLFPLIAREVEVLHRYHPRALVYVSAQGMDGKQYEDFYRLVAAHPAWLTGVFFGPQSRDSFETQRRRIPTDIPLIFYPDIAHTMHAQFPVPQWDPVFALTEGREPIDPRPVDEAAIYRHFAVLHTGFVTYSEGVNDDVNKFLWNQWGWNSAAPAREILEDYARFFIGPQWTRAFAGAISDLEMNWRGPLISNAHIEPTLKEFQRIEQSPDAPRANWRFELALYRAYYDAFLQRRLRVETAQQQQAIEDLRKAPVLGAGESIHRAETALAHTAPDSTSVLHDRIFALAGDLFHHIGIQLSVNLYGASNWERGANLDRIDLPLNDRVWLSRQFEQVRALPVDQQAAALLAIADRDQAPSGGFYDDLGTPQREPHLVRGPGFASDPEFYQTAIDGVADHSPADGWTWAKLTYAEALYEAPLRLHYEKLDPVANYRLRVVYAGEDYALPLTLVANHAVQIHPALQRKTNPQTMEFDLPRAATQGGTLDLEWARPAGLGGSGRGRQIAEVWLFPVPAESQQERQKP